eukprot:TRINITY_DN12147_c0_g1_i1.p1 TRINITY_DN12147_c0_g1~~TRINITY_DN12147_c0_g1_i1.p1  ORF type:complete len:593 (+),score=154.24 TRINITY_DN12147_c0_g1_i1:160-1938(+)
MLSNTPDWGPKPAALGQLPPDCLVDGPGPEDVSNEKLYNTMNKFMSLLERLADSQENMERRLEVMLEQIAQHGGDGLFGHYDHEPSHSPGRGPPHEEIGDCFSDQSARNGPPGRGMQTVAGIEAANAARLARRATGVGQIAADRAAHPMCADIVHSKKFDLAVMVGIITNATLIGAETELWGESDNSIVFKAIVWVQNAIAVAFFFEWCLRLLVHEPKGTFFKGKRGPWNMFDTIMVLLSMFEGGLDFFMSSIQGVHENETLRTTLLVAKWLRLLRLMRLMRFNLELRMMLIMILESTKSLVWMVVLLLMIFYFFAVFFTLTTADFVLYNRDAQPDIALSLDEHFGSIPKSCYSTFKAITGGQSWYEMADPVRAMGPFPAFIWIFYIVFSVIVLLNVVTGIFVDGAMTKSKFDREKAIQAELDQKKAIIDNLREIFQESDEDQSGMVTFDEFVRTMEDPRVQTYMAVLQINLNQLPELFDALDKDGSGDISVEEFVENLLAMMGVQEVLQQVQKVLDWCIHLDRHRALMEVDLKTVQKHVNEMKEVNDMLKDRLNKAKSPNRMGSGNMISSRSMGLSVDELSLRKKTASIKA